jgi:cholesterol oxidase
MCDHERIRLTTCDGIELDLYRFRGKRREPGTGKQVLLLHGASASHRTFLEPGGGLASWLWETNRFDPWMLDWRGSGMTIEKERNQPLLQIEDGNPFTFNRAAQIDVPLAVRTIRGRTAQPIGALGFCMGSAVLAESVARGCITAEQVDAIVLMTLGLFYQTPIDGRLKSDDRLLERLERSRRLGLEQVLAIDPRDRSWPPILQELYDNWPAALKPHDEAALSDEPTAVANRMCNRLGFMYGMPYNHANLVPEIHGRKDVPGLTDLLPLLPRLFGAIPLTMYIHGGQNIRRGQATDFETGETLVSAESHAQYARLTKVTLITGALNRLWHRDSIDRMFEWLCRCETGSTVRCEKHVIPTYGHQDLLWGRSSSTDVFPRISAAFENLQRPADAGPSSIEASDSRQRIDSQGMRRLDATDSQRR